MICTEEFFSKATNKKSIPLNSYFGGGGANLNLHAFLETLIYIGKKLNAKLFEKKNQTLLFTVKNGDNDKNVHDLIMLS